MTTQFDIKTDDIRELVRWLQDHTKSVNEGKAMLLATLVAMAEFYESPKPSREEIIGWATEAITSFHMQTEQHDDITGIAQLHGRSSVN